MATQIFSICHFLWKESVTKIRCASVKIVTKREHAEFCQITLGRKYHLFAFQLSPLPQIQD